MKPPPEPRLRLCAPVEPTPLALRDDDALMLLAKAGVQAALAELVRRHQAALRSYCARVCGASLADDVAQEVFVTVWSLRERYEPRGQFRAYLFTLAERRALNALRKGARAARWARLLPDPAGVAPEQLDVLLAGERQRRLDHVLEKLPAEQRRAIQLRYAAGLDYEEIAAIVARPVATVRVRVFLGLKRLRALLKGGGRA